MPLGVFPEKVSAGPLRPPISQQTCRMFMVFEVSGEGEVQPFAKAAGTVRAVPGCCALFLSGGRRLRAFVSVSYTHLDVYKRQVRRVLALPPWKIQFV